jgi:hypothetical protein
MILNVDFILNFGKRTWYMLRREAARARKQW